MADYSFSELKNTAERELRDAIREKSGDDLDDDLIHEIADSHTPVYNYNILMFAAENLSEIGLFDLDAGLVSNEHSDVNPVTVARAAIYEALREHLTNVMDNRHLEAA